VSLQAASAVVRRMILELESPVDNNGVLLYTFPNAATVLAAHDRVLRGVGLSAGKVATLRRAGEALESKTLTEQMLEERSSSDAVVLLRQIKGVGPWTATLILLRGMGRLDVFPMNDSGVARNLALVAGAAQSDVSHMLETLGEQRGMLYYSLLLARLDARGEVGLPSVPPG
jgi:DNA-3-methyladenine glycosylase II